MFYVASAGGKKEWAVAVNKIKFADRLGYNLLWLHKISKGRAFITQIYPTDLPFSMPCKKTDAQIEIWR
jgi:hypothetical protein